MFTCIIATGNVHQCVLCMDARSLCHYSPRRIVTTQSRGNISQAPGTTQVQAIEMDQFWIAAI